MSNIIPPLLSDTPPPPPDIDDPEDDEFGDFTGINNFSYDCDDSFSPPGSPLQLPTEPFDLDDPVPAEKFDINSNSKENMVADMTQLDKSKDFLDKRKDVDSIAEDFVDSSFFQGPISSKCNENNDNVKLPISSNTTAPIFVENPDLADEHSGPNELKNSEKTQEIIETNCDKKTTSSRNKISMLSSSDRKDTFEELFSKNLEPFNENLNTEDSEVSNISNDVDNLSDFPVGATPVVIASEYLLDNNIEDTEISKQCKNLGNNSSIEDTSQIFKSSNQIDNEAIIIAEQVDNDLDKSQNINKNPTSSQGNQEGLNKSEIAEISDLAAHTSETQIKSEQNCEESRNNLDKILPVILVLENEESTLTGDSISLEVGNVSVESMDINATCPNDNDFGAFIGNTGDEHKFNLENNEFGSFATLSFDDKQLDSLNHVTMESKEIIDDFDGFPSLLSTLEENVLAGHSKEKTLSNNFNSHDFGNFATSQTKRLPERLPNVSNDNPVEPEFEDFASFPALNTFQTDLNDEDDFGDFATTSVAPTQKPLQSSQYSKIILLNEKQALEKSTEIIKQMFPSVEQTLSDFKFEGLEANDKIFNQIKNVTDTHALSYQWPKSASQNLLLKSLNIDSRNILYGPGWNPSMPRFAANLSRTPLEPVKSEILTPTPVKETNSTSSTHSLDVEPLQFHLGKMVPTDPLDYLEQLVAQLEIPSTKITSSYSLSSPANEFENWEAWLQSIPPSSSADTASDLPQVDLKESAPAVVQLVPTILHDLNPHTPSSKANLGQKALPRPPTITHDDFDEFVSYSSPEIHVSSHGHSIILRETHISNKEPSKTEESDIVSWLEPTIVTPELTRKEREFVDADDECDEFQMVVTPEDQSSKSVESPTSLKVKPLYVVPPQPVVTPYNGSSQTAMNLDFIEETLGNGTTKNKGFKNGENKEPETITSTAKDDDFGDFTFSLPNDAKRLEETALAEPPSAPIQLPSEAAIQPLTPAPLLEPLKPSIVQNQNMACISWPDPGITDDEISRFEALGYSRAQNKQSLIEENNKEIIKSSLIKNNNRKGSIESSLPHKTNNPAKTAKAAQKSKQNSLDEEEWSDFVSVKNSSPVYKLKTGKERSSTPDLPLSVLNLGNVQPAKQPIPVITPNGLVQTKLSSNVALSFPNMMQQTNRMYPQPQVQSNPAYQPSIISNQYASQAYTSFSNYGSYQPQSSSKTNVDDDEWSEFMSHQPTIQKTTQSKPPQGWSNQPNQLTGWMNTTPNIITNPAANFNAFNGSSVQKQSKNVAGSVQNRRSGEVPSISIPDLDFLAPRNRTTPRK